jgi:acetyl esterase/lipase
VILRLFAAFALLFLALWIVVPGWTYPLFVLAVGAPELSPWLFFAGLVLCLLFCLLSAKSIRRSRWHRISLAVALCATALTAIPLVQAASMLRRFDEAMRAALGTDFLRGVPGNVRGGMRPSPIVPADLFRGIDFGETRVVRGIPFAAPGGQPLTLDIYRPLADGRFPVIVQIYGGAWQRGAPADNSEFARYLAMRGYAVFAIDYRHAPRWTWPSQIEDVRAALVWVTAHAAEYGADPSRMALIGRSAGAQLALLAAYETGAPTVRAAVSFYGPVDLAEGYRHPPRPDPLDVRAIEETLLSGTPDSAPVRYREASPVTYVNRQLPPTLLLYGSRDHVVEARFGRMLDDRLRATGTTSVLLEIPWAEHAFDLIPSGLSSQIALYYVERFLAWALTR